MVNKKNNFNFLGNTNPKFNHLGLAVVRISDTKIPELQITEDPIQKVKIAFIDMFGCPIELIEQTTENSPVSNSIKRGRKLLHICFEVDNIEEAIRVASRQGFKIISKPVSAKAFCNRHVIWLYHDVWGLFELIERS